MKILVVEDHPVNRELLDLMVRRLNHETILAVNGREAISKAISEHPDLILMDLRMPEVDGFEATLAIKKEKGTKNIPVIAVSANAVKEDIEKAIKNGCARFVAKPVTKQKLESLLKDYEKK